MNSRILTKVMAVLILVGAILSLTPQAWAMDYDDYASWVVHTSILGSALTRTGTTVLSSFVADVGRLKKEGNTAAISTELEQTKKIFSELSKATLELKSWAEEITPSDPAFSASHSHRKKGLEYQHLTFVAGSAGNWGLMGSYTGKAREEFATASQLFLAEVDAKIAEKKKVGDFYESALEQMRQNKKRVEEAKKKSDAEALPILEKRIKELEAKGEAMTDSDKEGLRVWRSLRDQILKKE